MGQKKRLRSIEWKQKQIDKEIGEQVQHLLKKLAMKKSKSGKDKVEK